MRILICDDDQSYVNALGEYVVQFFDKIGFGSYEIVSFNNGKELMDDQGEKDVVLLDIEMPGVNGITVGEMLKRRNKECIIIVVTSYNEYLDDAMRFEVFRYLTKPIDKQRLFRCLNDAVRKHNDLNKKIIIETQEGVHPVYIRDIYYMEIQTRKKVIYTTNGEYESVQPAQEWYQLAGKGGLFRSHRNFVINMKYVSDFSRDTIWLCEGKYRVYLTRRKYREFKENYILYLERSR